MKIRVTIQEKDLLLFNLRSLLRFPSTMVFGLVMVLVAATNLDIFEKYGALVFIIFIVLFFLFFLAISIVMVLIVLLLTLKIRDQKSVLCDHEFEFEEEYFVERTEFNESKYPWKAVSKYVNSKRYYYVYVSGSMAHIIPKSCLSDGENKELDQLFREKLTSGTPVTS